MRQCGRSGRVIVGRGRDGQRASMRPLVLMSLLAGSALAVVCGLAGVSW
jgi:hypothetical protein